MDKTALAIDVFNKRAKDYQDRFMDVDLYHDTFDLFCYNMQMANARILELACGPGNITKYLLNRRPDFKILGTDLAPNMLDLAKVNNPETEFRLMDCREIAMIDEVYDGIMCGFCLPYLSRDEAIKLIRDCSKIISTGGVLYISTMEGDYSSSRLETSSQGDRLYIHYHQADYLMETLTQNGFKVIKVQRKDFFANDKTKTTDLVLIARKE